MLSPIDAPQDRRILVWITVTGEPGWHIAQWDEKMRGWRVGIETYDAAAWYELPPPPASIAARTAAPAPPQPSALPAVQTPPSAGKSIPETKVCSKCREALPQSEYYRQNGALQAYCKVCMRTAARTWWADRTPEQKQEIYAHRREVQTIEQKRECNRLSYQRNKAARQDYSRQYYEDNREAILVKARQRYVGDKRAKANAYHRALYEASLSPERLAKLQVKRAARAARNLVLTP